MKTWGIEPVSLGTLAGRMSERLAEKPQLLELFRNAIRNTWGTTLKKMEDGTTFVITGDIPAMWLRDSAAQVRPFLALAAEDREVADLIEGLVVRQLRFILHDPYANAFNQEANGHGHQSDDTDMSPWIWERKYEIDSLCYPLQLSYLLWKNTGRMSQFGEEFVKAANVILDLWTTEQRHETDSGYRFERKDGAPTDTLIREGKGAETAYTGMTWSGFRPSDDACEYGYLIPSNMFAVVVLGYLQEIARDVLQDERLFIRAHKLAAEIDDGIQRFGIVQHPEFGPVYAYETDGLGHYNLMDDANVPSLLSIPYLGYRGADDEVYRNTRRFVLSGHNPYFYRGSAAEGIGSPHTPRGYVWHIALAMQGLTEERREEKERLLRLMSETDAGTGLMHESFNPDDPNEYTRPWFSWANMMFCELLMDYCGIRVKR
ncbi:MULTISPECIES: glycoside hydrolase family 125 protein [Paenibacillus]|uniref:Glycosyl hydrolase n=1 Tax=Paenibacillus albilobatus TaxID=2716884 RepID=A0A919XIJ4_9BACL|nr:MULTISPECIES: glycoside hydrolase family 125 protein [Paenibacillus]GIO32384.1 glycosyl hydrolase [Paenibacillus albilobatus]